MRDVIGKKLEDAISILEEEGYVVSIKKTISDKQKEWDSMIVLRQNLTDNTVELVVSNFKLEI